MVSPVVFCVWVCFSFWCARVDIPSFVPRFCICAHAVALKMPILQSVRIFLLAKVFDLLFGALVCVGALLGRIVAPFYVRIERGVSYGPSPSPEHCLDVYQPLRQHKELLPCVLYIHGGGFRLCNSATHWLFYLPFICGRPFPGMAPVAPKGFHCVVFGTNYRKGAYPAAVEDVCSAYLWLHKNASRYGGDPGRIIVAGDSAGANLSVLLAMCCCYDFGSVLDVAGQVFALNSVPRTILPVCGLFRIKDASVHWYKASLFYGTVVGDLLESIEQYYFRDDSHMQDRPPSPTSKGDYSISGLHLAEPLTFFQSPPAQELARDLPPIFMATGDLCPIKCQSENLYGLLTAQGHHVELQTYRWAPHVFNGMPWLPACPRYWADASQFCAKRVN